MKQKESQQKLERPQQQPALTEQERFSLEKQEHRLDHLMEILGPSFKEIGRMVALGGATVKIKISEETGIKSALVRKENGELMYSTSNEQEIAAFELLSKRENYLVEYFMSKDPGDRF